MLVIVSCGNCEVRVIMVDMDCSSAFSALITTLLEVQPSSCTQISDCSRALCGMDCISEESSTAALQNSRMSSASIPDLSLSDILMITPSADCGEH